jgi:hypothetical protein
MRKTYVTLGVVGALLAATLVIVLAMPAITRTLRETQRITDQKQIAETVLGLAQPPYEDDYQVTRVPGYIDNLSGSTLAKVDLQIQLTDGKGNRKELIKHSLTDIAPRSRKTFDVSAGTVEGSRNARITVTGIDVVK